MEPNLTPKTLVLWKEVHRVDLQLWKKNLNVFLFLALGSGACPAWSDVSDLLHCLYACSNFFKWSFHEKPICQVHLSFGQFSMLSNASSMCLSTCGKNNNAGK